jgi:putative flavoprotein involved in K+ transport
MSTVLNHSRQGWAGTVDVIVIGAGHSGLAMSHRLTELCIDHVVLERGKVANSWRTERWDSLRLFTPKWMNRLPGMVYDGNDPHGYMDMSEMVEFVSAYALQSDAPVRTHTTVLGVRPCREGYTVSTNQGEWWCRAVVIASGAFNDAAVPKVSNAVPSNILQVTAKQYRNPKQLPEGGVLVVGASATGLQLAQEIQLSGRATTLAVSSHVRMPRYYRGRDIQWWMLASGILDQQIADVDDPTRVRRLPSPQLIGTADHSTIDLNVLSEAGVRLAGRLAGVRNGKAQFSGALRNVCSLADLKMRRMLRAFDDWAASSDLPLGIQPPETFGPTRLPPVPTLDLNFASGEVKTIVWATGYRPNYSWLDVPVLDGKGNLKHDGGAVSAPGIYALGLPFLRRRKSSFIHGAEDDVVDLSQQLASYLGQQASRRAMRIAV